MTMAKMPKRGPVQKKPLEGETALEEYVRLSSDDLAFWGHQDTRGWVCMLSATADVPSRADLIEGWLSVPVVEIREIDGRSVSSPVFRLTRAQAELKEAMNRGEIPIPSSMEILWSGWADLVREAAA